MLTQVEQIKQSSKHQNYKSANTTAREISERNSFIFWYREAHRTVSRDLSQTSGHSASAEVQFWKTLRDLEWCRRNQFAAHRDQLPPTHGEVPAPRSVSHSLRRVTRCRAQEFRQTFFFPLSEPVAGNCINTGFRRFLRPRGAPTRLPRAFTYSPSSGSN